MCLAIIDGGVTGRSWGRCQGEGAGSDRCARVASVAFWRASRTASQVSRVVRFDGGHAVVDTSDALLKSREARHDALLKRLQEAGCFATLGSDFVGGG